MEALADLFLFLCAHPALLCLVLVAGVASFVLWLIKPPTWKDLDKPDLADAGTLWERLFLGRSWFRWW